MDTILIYPILLPVVAGLICLLIPKRARVMRELLTLVSVLATLFIAIYIFRQAELSLSVPWFNVASQLQISIDLRATPFTRFVLVAAASFALLVVLYSFEYLSGTSRHQEYHAYLLWALGAAAGTVLAGNLVMLLLFWELLGLTLYLMIMISGSEAISAATKALIIAVIGDMCLLMGIILIWLATGLLDMQALAAQPLVIDTPIMLAAFLLMLAGSFAKAGVIPLHTWIPTISTKAPIPVMSYFTALDKLIGIYLLARVSLEWFEITPGLSVFLMTIGAIGLLSGVLMAMIQHDYRRMLAFHSISQVGYMVLGIGTGTPIGIVGGLFHMLNMVILKGSLFLCGGSVQRQTGRTEFAELGGLAKAMPWTFVSTLVAALGISGVPPLNAFVSKWLIYQGILDWGGPTFPIFLVVAMFGSALTLASFMKLMYSMFWGERAEGLEHVVEAKRLILVPIVILAGFALAFGIFYQWPVQTLLQPLFPQTVGLAGAPGLWDSGMATILLVVSLLAGIPIYLLGQPRKMQEADVFLGGEALPSEAYRVRGTHFYGPVKEFRGLKRLYALGDAGAFDPYQYAMRGLDRTANWVYEYFDQALADFYQEVIPSTLSLGGQILRLLNTRLVLTYLMWLGYAAGVTGLLLFPDNQSMVSTMRVLACVGMVVWGILAWVETDLKRLLILAATSQCGFVLLGLTLSTNVAISYLITGSIALVVLFLLSFSFSKALNTSDISKMHGLAARMPARFLLFLLAALWLSGLPPFGSFFSKFLLGVAAGEISPLLTIIITGTALITLGYLLRPIRNFLRS